MRTAPLLDIPNRFYQWGTLNTIPWRVSEHLRLIEHVGAMTAPGTLEVLRAAAECLEGDECYLEVGTWRGGTLIGALRGNPGAQGWAIDNDALGLEHSPDGKTGAEAWAENIAWAGLAERAHYVSGTVPDVTLTIPPVGAYLFDGDKGTIDAVVAGLNWAVPYLAPQALILIDDANVPQIRFGVAQFKQQYSNQVGVLMDQPTPANGWHTFWNGLLILWWEA